MYEKQAGLSRPVPMDIHYDVLKMVEEQIHAQLSGLDHEYFVVGLRVAYDEKESSNEPGVLPYVVEFGKLGPADVADQCGEDEEVDADVLIAATKNAPISLSFLDHLLDYATQELQAAANTQLNVGVSIVLTGSTLQSYTVSCRCKYRTRKRYCYYDKNLCANICHCSTNDCG